jgi:hypothetical protein
MFLLINGKWYSTLEVNTELALEITEDEIPMFNEISDNAHKTHGKAIILDIPFTYLINESNGKTKTTKCKVGFFKKCIVSHIDKSFLNNTPYVFFTYESKQESF